MQYSGHSRLVRGDGVRCLLSDYEHIALQVYDGVPDLRIVDALDASFKEYEEAWKGLSYAILIVIVKAGAKPPSPGVQQALSDRLSRFGMAARTFGIVFFNESLLNTIIRVMIRGNFVVNARFLKGKSPLTTFENLDVAAQELTKELPSPLAKANALKQKIFEMRDVLERDASWNGS